MNREARNPNIEIVNKYEIKIVILCWTKAFGFLLFVLRICFGFRNSNFGFWEKPLASVRKQGPQGMVPSVMKVMSSLMVVLAVVAVVAAGGAAPTHDEVVKQMLTTLEKLTTTLTPITNAGTADAAKPELRKTAQAWVELRAKAEKLPPPTREEKTRLEKEYKGKIEAAQRKLFAEVVRVQNLPGGTDALKEIRGVLSKPMK
jgi:hypothetical protein